MAFIHNLDRSFTFLINWLDIQWIKWKKNVLNLLWYYHLSNILIDKNNRNVISSNKSFQSFLYFLKLRVLVHHQKIWLPILYENIISWIRTSKFLQILDGLLTNFRMLVCSWSSHLSLFINDIFPYWAPQHHPAESQHRCPHLR